MTTFLQRLLLLILLPLFLYECEKGSPEEMVPIPDSYFMEALIKLGVDKDGDGQISVPEAGSTLSLMLSPSLISDLSGLEAFINLDSLKIEMNPLDSLDIRNNRVLKYLECTGCELSVLDVTHNPELRYLDCSGGASLGNMISELDLSKNTALEHLDCAENRISSLDLSNNIHLRMLNCGRNQIQTLDVSGNSELTQLTCNNNLLTSLDVSRNQSLQKLITCGNQLLKLNVSSNSKLKVLGVDNMSTITEVCVWTFPFPPEGVVVLKEFSPNVYFTSNCTF